ncbi:MAG TPA: aromatic ring-hydroxylating dioxygenase subunit alpha [Rhodocyclaceae bacterium]|nr:aromatic ring-hydroxylating dioxygenase subunit alpha [Rhodocyclaceae bacterium]HMV54271.1 aromatic ring-hydroxylating dioxygenase subunit alpha [Rhodocyclaceae bacterium]HMZ83122.1 aromatic ring-hydroxylating dioxygenase subunit alpha [Rhodocyclaceae bacterium]HNA03775.1 aromatic ring-hydroxylating dioxygenase subunit alpha [Rhodocyclaceae bacterium]HNB78023.1 aromatic ring-hydroxylating dioxygenase subunit alpha [Rhodocyclaceae bacterium]
MESKIAFLENAWYVAALSTELGAEALFHRKILDVNVLIYRKQDGTPVALRDRCPHRFAPLHMGKRVGDDVVCQYHGLRFDCSGKCKHSPHGNGQIPKASDVRSFPLVERDGFLWIWPGDPALAEASSIPDCSEYSRSPKSAVAHVYMHNTCNYELLADNIMDLTHIDHLHGPLINTGGKLSPLIPNVTEVDGKVVIRWDWLAEPAMPLLGEHLAEPKAPAKMFFEVVWHAPAVMRLRVGAVQGSDDFVKDGVVLFDYHIMTPESAMSTHYFFASTRNYLTDDAAYNEGKMQGMLGAFTLEDKPMIEAQQAEMGTHDLWALKPVLLSSDAGAIRVRRVLKAMIEAEQGARLRAVS